MKPPLLSHLYGIIAIVFWSSIELVSKLMGSDVSPWTLTAWRFLIGGLVILPFALRQLRIERRVVKLADIVRMVFLGILIVCVSMLILQLSIYYGKASLSGVLVGSNPLFVSVFAIILLKEKLGFGQIIGLFAGLLGITLLILGEGDLANARYLNLPLSIVLGLLAALTFGFYTVLTKKSVSKHGNLLTNSVSFLGGAVVLFAINAFTGKPFIMHLSPVNILGLLYLSVIISGFAYLLFFESMRVLGANQTALYFFLKPVLASLLAVLILRESLSGLQVVAIIVIISGLIVSRIWKKARPQ